MEAIVAQGSGLRAVGNCPEPRASSPQRLPWWSGGLYGCFLAPVSAWAFGSGGARVWLPDGMTSAAPMIDRVFYLILWITGIAFGLVQLTLLAFLVRYRRRPGQAAHYTHGNHVVEIIWTVVPAFILVFLAFRSQEVWSHVRGAPPAADLQVEILAEQFAWNIRYPGPDGAFGSADDVTTINQLHLPVEQTALLHVKSKDVIHSFFVPQFRMKLDAVPGLTGRLWVSPTKTGNVEIVCAELCGLGHYRMRGFLTIEPPEAFAAWLATTAAEEQ